MVTIIQSVVALYINYILYNIVKTEPESCHFTMGTVVVMSSLYLIFFILFSHLYFHNRKADMILRRTLLV